MVQWPAMAKKKKSEIQELSEFIRDNMVTRSEFKEELEKLATKDDLKKVVMRLDKVQITLDDHTRQLNIVRKDAETNLDKRLQLDVRVDRLEKARA